jgi:hypothetical protein
MSRQPSVRVSVSKCALRLTLVLGVLAGAAFAWSQQWPSITEAEKAVNQCPGQPGAPAVYLYREQTSNHVYSTFSSFARLKILTAAGKEYGAIEIPCSDVWKVEDIRARVLQPDGRIVPFTGEIYEKTVAQVGRNKMLIKTFALPNIDVGSIIEYGYRLRLDQNRAASAQIIGLEQWEPEEGGVPTDRPLLSYMDEIWNFDAPLYTFKAKYTYILFRRGPTRLGYAGFHPACVFSGRIGASPEFKDDRFVLEVADIPARPEEEWTAPHEEDWTGVLFFFLRNEVTTPEQYWRLESASWQKAVEKFLGGDKGVAEESRIVIAGAATPLEQLAELYARAQSINNLSYDRDMTPERREELKIKDNRTVGEVLQRNAGLRSDITRTFVALARAAGFEADVARVVTRDDKFFNKNFLVFFGLFDSELAIVKVGDREMFFDPATPGCPVGLVHWKATDTTYIRSSGTPGTFATVPPDPPERTQVKWTFDLGLGRDGGLSGSGVMVCTGQEALTLRLEYLGMDDAAARKSLGEKITAFLPAGGTASLRKIDNLAGSKDELRVEFDAAVPGAAAAAGDRLLLPAIPFRSGWRDAFRHADRTSSVYFRYPVREFEDITITLPEGLRVEAVPAAAHSERSFAVYSLAASVEDRLRIRITRGLTIGKSLIPLPQYPVLKSFFDQTRAGDDSQIVLSVDKKQARLIAPCGLADR